MNRFAFLLAGLGVIAMGCNEYELIEEDKFEEYEGEGLQPDIEVAPGSIAFGELNVFDDDGAASATVSEIVTVSNVGEGDLHIESINLNGDGVEFELSAISSVLIEPEGSAQFTVSFTPQTAADYDDSVLIESDDPDEPTVEVPLTGTGIAPVIDVSPAEFDFGSLYIGCDAMQAFTISNIGNADLEVTGFEFNTGSADFDFDDSEDINGDLPWLLTAGASAEVSVEYVPFDEYDDLAYLTVQSTDPYTPEVMSIIDGVGELYGENLDVFEQPIKGETDIIFAVDRSCSMNDDITNVQNNFDTFVNTLAGLDADYQVAATVEDSGCINGSDLYIDNTFSASDASTTVTTMINLGGSYGSNTERAFMLMEANLAETGSGGCNEGLVREDASLNIVLVSDEPEQSVNNYAYYVSLFQSLKDNADDVVIHAIGGDYPGGCGSASAYTGAYEATVATGGLFLSICATDWGTHLEALAEGSATDLSSFELSDWPVEETIVVKIDGVTTTIGWEYNPTDNAIDFDEDYVPEGGSTIEVEYALFGDCDT